MVYGEFGQFPLNIKINSSFLIFGNKIIGKDSKLCCIMHTLSIKTGYITVRNTFESPWITYVKHILK